MALNMRPSREAHTPDLQPRPSASSSLARLSLPANKIISSGVQSSVTWTSTSGDLGGLSDTDEIRERTEFVHEYNRIAKKYGIRPLVPDPADDSEASGVLPKRSWWSRTFRRTSSQSTEHSLRRQRSTSHVMGHLAHPKRDSLKDQDLQGLVRLCGKSFLYMPPEYAPGSLIVPTCFRATAQYLVQHAPETRGVFRIPGSIRVVNELYEFYCAEQSADVASTVRSPNLPVHINAGIHDVASCFKKFLSGIPGGILGSLSLFDALIAINSQLYGDPEFSRTKQSKIRARLIALAVGTLRSQFRRELICAVFGLLCLLGRAAETAPREDEFGRPLPTSDLMGYNALGIVFGPLLVGDMLGSYAVKLADPSSGLFIVPKSPSLSKSQRGRKKAKELAEDHGQTPFLDVDKIHVANDITEMLVTNWRDVVRQMRSLDATISGLRSRSCSRSSFSERRPRRSSSFGMRSENDPHMASQYQENAEDDSVSLKKYTGDIPRLSRRYTEDRCANAGAPGNRAVSFRRIDSTNDALSVRKTRPSSDRNISNTGQSFGQSGALSPKREETAGGVHEVHPATRLNTPLKSSLKSSASKRIKNVPVHQDQTSDENTSPASKSATSSQPRWPPVRVAGSISTIRKHFEKLETQPRQRVPSPTYPSETRRAEYGQLRQRATPASTQTSNSRSDKPRQPETPSHTGAYSPEHVGSKTLNKTTKPEHGEFLYRGNPSRSENHGSGYDSPRSRATLISTQTSKPRNEQEIEYAGNSYSYCFTSMSSPKNDSQPTTPRALTQVHGFPDRDTQKPSCDLDHTIAYLAEPGVKILEATSTMRSQPKMSHMKPQIAAAKLRSSVWRTSSGGSANSGGSRENESVEKSGSGSKPEGVARDQMDGAADFIVSVPASRGSFIDTRGECEGRGVSNTQASFLSTLCSRSQPHATPKKNNGHEQNSSWADPHASSQKLSSTSPGGIKPCANRVMDLAAMFDIAAKTSPFLPTPGGAIRKGRRETAKVTSPYTSNPSPRTSLQSLTSVSTPVSLMSPTRLSIHLSTSPRTVGNDSKIPRFRKSSAVYHNDQTKKRMSPIIVLQRHESRVSLDSSNTLSKLPTPSRLPYKKIVSTNDLPPLPQFDGLTSRKQSLHELTAQQETDPVGFYSNAIAQTKIDGGDRSIPRLSQQSVSSDCSDEIGRVRSLPFLSPTPSQGRSAFTLRQQIHSLRVELTAKNEDCAQLRFDLEESRKIKEVNESLWRGNLDRAQSDTRKWRRRAETAERKVDQYERLTMQIHDARDGDNFFEGYRREKQGETADDYSFMSGSDHLSTSDRATSQPLAARMNQSVRRTPPVDADGANADGFSECSSSTVVRTRLAHDENGPMAGNVLCNAIDEPVGF